MCLQQTTRPEKTPWPGRSFRTLTGTAGASHISERGRSVTQAGARPSLVLVHGSGGSCEGQDWKSPFDRGTCPTPAGSEKLLLVLFRASVAWYGPLTTVKPRISRKALVFIRLRIMTLRGRIRKEGTFLGVTEWWRSEVCYVSGTHRPVPSAGQAAGFARTAVWRTEGPVPFAELKGKAEGTGPKRGVPAPSPPEPSVNAKDIKVGDVERGVNTS